MPGDDKVLWFSWDRARYFLIPELAELPAGSFEIVRSLGTRLKVDAEALESFEITRDEATEWSRTNLAGILQRVGPGAERAATRPRPSPSSEATQRAGETAREDTEVALRGFAGLAGTLARAAQRAGARFEAAAEELRAKREAAEKEAAERQPPGEDGGET